MDWQAYTTLGIVALIMGLMAFTQYAPDILMIGGVTILMTIGILTPGEAMAGLSNEGMVTVAVLFIVAAGLRETGGMGWLVQNVLGRPKSIAGAQARMMFPVAGMSAFMNNTPLVAMLVPAIAEWAKKHKISPSKLMIPLSYATVLGGCITVIGTSTNVVTNGLVVKAGLPAFHLFDLVYVGLPCAVIGLIYLMAVSRWLLPDRKPVMSQLDDPRKYMAEMMVEPGSGLAGKTIEQAGLRHLSGMYLAEIERQGQVIAAPGPDQPLQGGDRLVFVGVVESVVELQKIRGLVPATDQVFKLDAPRSQRCLIEAVVSNTAPMAGQTIRDARFRTAYNAAVIAVARNGERVRGKIGDIRLEPGDTLLVEAHPSFVDQHRDSRDFFLVSSVADSTPPRHDRAWIAFGILGGMVLAAAMEWLTMLNAAMLAAGLMIVTRCVPSRAARRSVDWQVLLAIAASFGIGQAMEKTGAAKWIAGGMIGAAGDHPWAVLAAVYFVTVVATEVLSNNAAAVLIFPIAMSAAKQLGVDYHPFVITIMLAASCGFATPIGYQTHLMVYGPGGYRFSDYVKIGVPLDILMMIVAVALTPVFWPFHP